MMKVMMDNGGDVDVDGNGMVVVMGTVLVNVKVMMDGDSENDEGDD